MGVAPQQRTQLAEKAVDELHIHPSPLQGQTVQCTSYTAVGLIRFLLRQSEVAAFLNSLLDMYFILSV